MKNQYVGDINDYLKYSLLRAVQDATGGEMRVCWMTTEDDLGRDGQKRQYLDQPDKYRQRDPQIFDALRGMREGQSLDLHTVERAGLLPRCSFYRQILHDDLDGRKAYFAELWRSARSEPVIFFDPDNGLEIKSVPKGKKNSSKFLFLDEVERAGDGRSAIIYQHFPRVERIAYIQSQLGRIREVLPNHACFALAGSHVAFLIAAAMPDGFGLADAGATVNAQWPELRVVLAG